MNFSYLVLNRIYTYIMRRKVTNYCRFEDFFTRDKRGRCSLTIEILDANLLVGEEGAIGRDVY